MICNVFRVGIDLPTIEVKFEHLKVEADVNTGSRVLPSFINFHIELVEVRTRNHNQQTCYFILDHI